jgi:hypothetical protein
MILVQILIILQLNFELLKFCSFRNHRVNTKKNILFIYKFSTNNFDCYVKQHNLNLIFEPHSFVYMNFSSVY